MQSQEKSKLDRLMTFSDYLIQRTAVFPSIYSGIWYERQHREQLIKSGALLNIRGRKWVDPPVFDEQVMQIGRERAKRAQRVA